MNRGVYGFPQAQLQLPQRGTILPEGAPDGYEFSYIADATNGIIWRFKYNLYSSSPYRWEFIGGTQLRAEVTGTDSYSGTANVWADFPTTVGPSLTIPFDGDYHVQAGALCQLTSGRTYNFYVGVRHGSTDPATVNDWLNFIQDWPNIPSPGSADFAYKRRRTMAALTAGEVIKQVVQRNAGSANISCRELELVPIRVRGQGGS